MQNIVGAIVTDENFFDRFADLEQLRDAAVRQNVLLLAPRRVGKSSLLHRLREDLETGKDTFHAIYLSVEGVRDELDFVRELFREVEARSTRADRGLRRIKRFFMRAEEIEIASAIKLKLASAEPSTWQDHADELGALLARLEGHWFYLLDEVPVFVLRLLEGDAEGKRARAFLEWFRALRQRLSLARAPSQQALRHHWVLAGSIGLDTVAARYGLSATINDLATRRLGPFATSDAQDFLRALSKAEGVPLSEEVIGQVLDRVGWLIPFHLQLVFAKLREAYDRAPAQARAEPGAADVDRAIDALLHDRKEFDGWRERRALELGAADARAAFEILRLCAADPAGARKSTLEAALGDPTFGDRDERRLRFLLDALETDGYLVEHEGRHRFQSPLLREFWLRRYG